MCGIAAIFATEPGTWIQSELERSIHLVRHRGPDGSGFTVGDLQQTSSQGAPAHWGLAHARLAIVGLGEQGHQPMSDRDGRRWISFNGEVYNHLEIRRELEESGVTFATSTDTEVILAAWATWGPSCVERFKGMFAFVLVDLEGGTAHAVRDRLGIKPLYVWRNERGLRFASEIKQFTGCEGFRPRANLQLVHDFLFDGLAGHEPDQCCFQDVEVVRPGHMLRFEIGSPTNTVTEDRYWSMEGIEQDSSMDWTDAVEETRKLFIRSVELRMRADVPVGSCLSGGLDSSSIVCTVAHELGHGLHTISSCYEDRRFDEQEYIDLVNESAESSPIKVFPSETDAIESFDRILWHQDEPFISMSLLSQWAVMKAARTHGIPVMLDGQGGDEVFGGYRKFTWLHLMELVSQRRLLAAAGHAGRVLRRGDRNVFDLKKGTRYLPRFMRAASDRRMQARGHLEPLRRQAWSEKMQGTRDLAEHRRADLSFWSLPVLLRYEDRSSMAHSIEARVPFVDHDLVEHALRIPSRHLFHGGQSKSVFREAMRHLLPPTVRSRRTKMGFESAQQVWMRGRFGDEMKRRVRESDGLASIVDCSALLEHDSNHRDWTAVQASLFRAAVVAGWMELFDVAV